MTEYNGQPDDQSLAAAVRFAEDAVAELERQGKTTSPETRMAALQLGLRLHQTQAD
ncbi:hypothetical protein [Kitasatospora sp. NPDC047058]|uniref:hypothetical protein n=1 Tax=Kitasatospora sp. NPDC047058 TaxID=3155620 RepID=UPI0034040ED8